MIPNPKIAQRVVVYLRNVEYTGRIVTVNTEGGALPCSP